MSAASDEDPRRWRVYGERTLYDNPWVRLVRVDVEPPDGHRFEHHVVRLQRVVMVLALRNDGTEALILRRHRFVTDQVGWGLPGRIVDPGEAPEATAAREAEEETGYRPTDPGRKLLEWQPMVGMVDTPHEVWVFDQVERVGHPTDAAEAGIVGWVPLVDVPAMIDRGEILGGGSITGLPRYLVDHPVR
ncbi:NUDIX domain-containing protein [Nakamurella leprariae]|uniref:NUDIX domain-containing protein n=1 Tax=Nakamurella leprariae TaxID=2803911 RepID=A0A938YHN8_9ACTN|nr:NUDIX domain-containing protein [Nakamurella leprariae]MBM9467990.1 NUDIX domain-containing protein [Nakamurella leprariae]